MDTNKVLNEEETTQEQAVEQAEQTQEQATPTFDYEKLASLVNGKQAVAEDTVLKGYFKQQGMTPDEMTAAINMFKEQKAQATPDIAQMQNSIAQTTQRALAAEMQNAAMLMANDLGVDVNAMPYLVRMADVAEVTKGGEVDEAILKTKLEELVKAIPSLKKTVQQVGFEAVGVETSKSNDADDDELYRIFGVNKK